MTTTAGTVSPTITDVQAWRRYILTRAGYTPDEAELLADWPNVDLHQAVYLAESGCPNETALRILL